MDHEVERQQVRQLVAVDGERRAPRARSVRSCSTVRNAASHAIGRRACAPTRRGWRCRPCRPSARRRPAERRVARAAARRRTSPAIAAARWARAGDAGRQAGSRSSSPITTRWSTQSRGHQRRPVDDDLRCVARRRASSKKPGELASAISTTRVRRTPARPSARRDPSPDREVREGLLVGGRIRRDPPRRSVTCDSANCSRPPTSFHSVSSTSSALASMSSPVSTNVILFLQPPKC